MNGAKQATCKNRNKFLSTFKEIYAKFPTTTIAQTQDFITQKRKSKDVVEKGCPKKQ